MAAYIPHSHSQRARAFDPITPVHSPHHSANSSISSRTSSQPLTIHEYRKQQKSPIPLSTTPPNKILRRKAAASSLNEADRSPSTPRTLLASTRPTSKLRLLHVSHSAQQLTCQRLPPSPPHLSQQHGLYDLPLRVQSAEPRTQGRAGAEIKGFAARSGHKVRDFKPIKRLPKPNVTSGFGPRTSYPLVVTPPHQQILPLRSPSLLTATNSNLGDTQTSPSTLSLSRFPQPPHLVNYSIPPANDDSVPSRLTTTTFITTAPATPPATPAVVHYRGASFDLVNPHDSLSLHEIVTPSKDLDSTDYLPLQSSEDLLALSEMAPKRALYGDLTSAYASIITRHTEDNGSALNLELPLPPTPVARSSGSSQYTTPLHSPDSNFAVSPPGLTETDNESRFSLRQLTRSLTKKLAKAPEKIQDEELRELSGSRVSQASMDFDGEFPHPLNQSYHAITPKTPNFPDHPPTPTSPLDHAVNLMSRQNSKVSVEHPRLSSIRYSSAPLTSMVPDDPSIEVGRAHDVQSSMTESTNCSRPYYDDLASIYPSFSIYTANDHDRSTYAQSLSSDRMGSRSTHFSSGAGVHADEHKSNALLSYPDSVPTGYRASRPLTRELFHCSLQQGNDKTDTISKFIDEYRRGDIGNTSQPVLSPDSTDEAGIVTTRPGTYQYPDSSDDTETSQKTSGLGQSEYGLFRASPTSNQGSQAEPPSVETVRAKKSTLPRGVGMPPADPLPLAPAFNFGDNYLNPRQLEPSETFSGESSYGDTRQLLQLSRSMVADFVPGSAFEPSSSYSQPEISKGSQTPQEALEQADEIFANAAAQRQEEAIPPMWAKRSSAYLLHSKSQANNIVEVEQDKRIIPVTVVDSEGDVGEWETVGNNSNSGRPTSGDSIADYSSSEGSRDSLGFSSSLPVLKDPLPESSSVQYQHPSPLGTHAHPFTSSPPPLATRAKVRSAPDDSSPSSHLSSPRVSPTNSMSLPYYRNDEHNASKRSTGSPYTFAPWVSTYSLSEKVTQELLASGPNDEILYDDDLSQLQGDRKEPLATGSEYSPLCSNRADPPTTSSLGYRPDDHRIERENTYKKFSVLGLRDNLTGTPQGTGMHETGSSVADNSSPGAMISPIAYGRALQMAHHSPTTHTPSMTARSPYHPSFSHRRSDSSGTPGFYVSPSRTSSKHRVNPRLVIPGPSEQHDRTPSQVTLFPHPISEELSSPASFRRSSRNSLRLPSSPRRPLCSSRAAVYGQTKLRQMVLAPDTRSISSRRSMNLSHSITTGGSERPSTSNTHTPLRTHVSESTLRTVIAYEHSPHLLCPERAIDPLEEEERRKLSWLLFAVFCILPPMLILYRWMGDAVIINVTKGRITHVAPKPKSIALGAGIAINVSLSAAILLPILIAHATGAL